MSKIDHKIYIQSSQVDWDKSFDTGYYHFRNFIENEKGKLKEVSVDEFNSMKFSFIGEF
jgi:hypothetical protein